MSKPQNEKTEREKKYETFMRSAEETAEEGKKIKSRLTMIKSILMEPLKDLLIFENVSEKEEVEEKCCRKILENICVFLHFVFH